MQPMNQRIASRIANWQTDVSREISWSPEREAHIARHGVTPGEVEDVCYSRPRWIATGRAGSTLVYGTSAAGRYLLVVLAEALDGRQPVVTAREMTDSVRRMFRRKER
ncbi:MAG: uncharacterized protein QOH50_992 [Kribbellaceae bacterium]|nr:uncharacterized protein [Kribbellaceae bacterium]